MELELLSPAGNLDIFKSVVDAGADAIYFGGDSFGARAYAKNFSLQQAEEALNYAHLRGKKAYLTVNTLLKNLEIEKSLYAYMKSYVEMGLDAVIVQDLGVFSFIKDFFPDLPIHASTQMTITGAKGAKYLSSLGASRIVTAREMSLEEIALIHKETSVEIETFVHGALCMGYSGQCLMSSMIGGRSGNRGRCAQPCRLPYELLDAQKKSVDVPGPYVLSLKDLCGIEDLQSMAEAGVYSFKIEGRMKQIEYATGVVKIYRDALDRLLSDGTYVVKEQEKKQLFDLGNRNGFTNTYYYKQNDASMMTFTSPKHSKKVVTEKVDVLSNNNIEEKIPLTAFLAARIGCPLELRISDGISQVNLQGEVVEKAIKNATTEDEIKTKLNKLGNTPFYFESIDVEMDSSIFLPMKLLNQLRHLALEELMKQRIGQSEQNRILPYQALCETVVDEKAGAFSLDSYKVFATCMQKHQYHMLLHDANVNVIGLPLEYFLHQQSVREALEECIDEVHRANKQICLSLPLIFRNKGQNILEQYMDVLLELPIDSFLVANYDSLQYLLDYHVEQKRIMLDARIYTWNNRAIHFLNQQGFQQLCAPVELHANEMKHRENRSSFMPIYGRQILMLTANCQKANAHRCNKIEELYTLKDRFSEEFIVRNVCSYCYNEIYNSRVYNLIEEITNLKDFHFLGLRLDFTFESEDEMLVVLEEMEKQRLHKSKVQKKSKVNDIYTKGHWKRGVE